MKNLHYILLTLLMAVRSSLTFANDFEAKNADGVTIYYKITSSEDLTCGVTYSGYFYGSVSIPSSVEYNGKSYSVTSIGDRAFYGCSSLTSVEIPNSVTSIGSYAFYGCSSLTSVEIPNSVTSIGYKAFEGCSSLSTPIYNNSIFAFLPSSYKGDYKIPEGISIIAASAFAYCSSLKTIKIPDSVREIGTGAFYNCTNLISVKIPNSVSIIKESTFENCSKLKLALIGSGVTLIENEAFYGCNSLSKLIFLPNSKPYFYSSFTAPNNEGRITYVSNDNYQNNYYFGKIKKYDYLSSWFEVDSVLYVPVSPSERTCAAIDCTKSYDTKEVVIGETVNYKGVGMKVVELNPYFLYNYNKVEKVKLPESIKEIGDYAFYGCSSLTDFKLPSSLQTLGKYAFSYMPIKSVVIPAATTEIGDGAFNYCTKLESFEAKDGKESLRLGYYAKNYWGNDQSDGLFYDCPLKEVVIGRNLVYETDIYHGYSPFYKKQTLEKVTISDVPTEVFTNEFYGCTSLKNVSIGDRVKKIGDYAFSGCSALDYFAFGASVESIGKEAFSDCTNLTKLYAEPATPPTCGTQALDDINKWNCTLYVPQSAIASYQKADQWKEFFFMEAGQFENPVTAPSASHSGKTFNLQGVEMGDGYRGIIIKDGRKVVKR